MTSAIEHLDRAIRDRHDYFRSPDIALTIYYIRHVIEPALRVAVREHTTSLLSKQEVDTTQTREVIHYTGMDTLFAFLSGLGEPGHISDNDNDLESYNNERSLNNTKFLRLYDSTNLNDPTEGHYFLKRLTSAYSVLRVPAYITSFVRPRKTATNPDSTIDKAAKARDNLVFWRHYGEDGKGCSISIPADRFTSERSLTLYSVIYGSQAADSAAEEIRPVIERVDDILSPDLNPRAQRQLAATIIRALGELPYLYKSSAYDYEEECRLMFLESSPEHKDPIQYEFRQTSGGHGRPRMYVNHPCLNLTNVLSTGSCITLGPCVPNVDNVQYTIDKLLFSIGIRDFPVEISKIPYRLL